MLSVTFLYGIAADATSQLPRPALKAAYIDVVSNLKASSQRPHSQRALKPSFRSASPIRCGANNALARAASQCWPFSRSRLQHRQNVARLQFPPDTDQRIAQLLTVQHAESR